MSQKKHLVKKNTYFHIGMDFDQGSQFNMNDLYEMILNIHSMCVKHNRNKNCYVNIHLRFDFELGNQDMESDIIDKLYKLFFEWMNVGLICFEIYCDKRSNNFNLQAQKEKIAKYFSKEKFDQYDAQWKEKLLQRRKDNRKANSSGGEKLPFKDGVYSAEINGQHIEIMNASYAR